MLFKSILRKLAYVAAAFVILVAVLVVAMRLLTPLLDTHHADIEKWASQLLDSQVKIEKIRLSWYGYQPVVSLDKVIVLDQISHEPIIEVKEVGVFFSIPRSLWHWQPVPAGLMLVGADLNVHETATGEYSIQGFPTIGGFDTQPYSHESKFGEVAGWLTEQPRLILRDIDIRYTGFKGKKRFVTLHNLSLNNSNSHHSVYGKAILHQDLPTELTVAIDWDGQPVDLSQLKANIYLYVSGLSIPQWLKDESWQGWQIKDGVASAKIWATWDKGVFERVQSVFQLYRLNLYSQTNKSTHEIRRISGDIAWKKDGNMQVIAADDVLIDLPSHLWPITNFYLAFEPDATNTLIPKTLHLGYLNIEDVQSLLFASSATIPDDIRKLILALKIKGELRDTSIAFPEVWNDWNHIKVETEFKNLHFNHYQSIPGINNIAGVLQWDGIKGNVSLNSHQTAFQYPSIFNTSIEIEQLSGNIAFQQNENKAWVVNLSSLQMLNNDLTANVSGSLTVPEKGAVIADLKANYAMEEVKHLNRYLPANVFEPGLAKWLNQAFLAGEIKSGDLILRGPLDEFPFDKNGEFLATANVTHLDLHYAPDWPVLEQIGAKVVFSGRKIEIDLNHAQLVGITVDNAHGNIPYLGDEKPAVLQVDVKNIKADFSQALELVRKSPLQKTLGKMFASMNVQGPIQVQLGLTVPLATPDDATVKGEMEIFNATMDLSPWGLMLNKLSGNVNFTEKSTSAKNLQALLFNKPIQFDLSTIEKEKIQSVVQANFSTTLAIDDLEGWLKFPITKVAKGETAVTGEIDLSNQLPIEVRFKSSLSGVTLDLPDQYSKSAKQARNFSAVFIADENKPLQAKLIYSDLLSAALILNKKKDSFQLSSANLRLGGGDPAWPTASGLTVTGILDELNWDKIKTYMDGSSQDSMIAGLPFRGADVQFNKLSIFGQSLEHSQIKVTPEEDGWNIGITSQDIIGNIDIPKVFSNKEQITAHFEQLKIQAPKEKIALNDFQVKSLPALSLVLNHVNYNGIPVGQIALNTSPSANGQTIQSLRINSPRISFNSSGTWTQTSTHLQGKADSVHVSDLLESLGIDAHNFVANKCHANFDVTWQDMLYAPALTSMNGSISFDFGPGRIVDVGQDADAKMGIGRMLSLFSLQTIPRRLALDFSDVFQKGYSFDSIRGDFKLNSGDAYTNNLRFKGPVASLDIVGKIGLKDKDFDLTLGITPMDVTSGIPLAAAYLTGPVGGLAALAVNTVIGKQISRAATYHYAVKGSWSNPSFDKIN